MNGNCHDCRNKKSIRPCEIHNPELAKICKDCCITKMKGHSCSWYELCWPGSTKMI